MLYQYLSRIGCSKSHLHNQMVKFEYISDDMSWNGGYYYVLLISKCVFFFFMITISYVFFLQYLIFIDYTF